jgi:hypothetical protein
MLYSAYFRSNEKELTTFLSAALNQRGQRCTAIRNHAKIIAMQAEDGRTLIVETSANLRSCRNVEQFTFTNDPELLAFHRAWLDVVLGGSK